MSLCPGDKFQSTCPLGWFDAAEHSTCLKASHLLALQAPHILSLSLSLIGSWGLSPGSSSLLLGFHPPSLAGGTGKHHYSHHICAWLSKSTSPASLPFPLRIPLRGDIWPSSRAIAYLSVSSFHTHSFWVGQPFSNSLGVFFKLSNPSQTDIFMKTIKSKHCKSKTNKKDTQIQASLFIRFKRYKMTLSYCSKNS